MPRGDRVKLTTLYKKTSTGAIQEWSIFVKDVGTAGPVICVVTRYGQVGGKIQETSDLISKGKNVGKKNETTPLQQAEFEAIAKWEKQKKKGYVESIDGAEADELDDLIEGGILPMLAHKFSEHGHKVKYPCFVQPKLDGIRCIAIVKDGACTLWSRTRKQINSCPHIVQELEALFESVDVVLDGELYNADFKDNFEHIVHLVRQEEPNERCTDIQYHIYDVVTSHSFETRFLGFSRLMSHIEDEDSSSLRLVVTEKCSSEDKVMDFFDKYKGMGYEGAMLRNADSKYVNKRSYNLLKVKEFDDGEFDIIGIEEGRGKLQGHVGAFVCQTPDGQEFKAKMSGDTAKLREFFNNHSLWHGKRLTVQHQGLTAYGVPRFPVGVRTRDAL
jgi:DNA ligase 1